LKLLLSGAWWLESIINLAKNMDVAKMENPLGNLDAANMQNFVVLEILLKLHHEFSFESIDPKEIEELSNSQFDPQIKPTYEETKIKF
jgi:hypothetical protein